MSKNELKSISRSLKRMATLIEKDPKFLAELERWVNNYVIPNEKSDESNYEDAVPMDVFDVYSRAGAEGLRLALHELEISELRKIIMSNNLDPSKLSHKWKDKERMIKLILERIAARVSQGSAFMNYRDD